MYLCSMFCRIFFIFSITLRRNFLCTQDTDKINLTKRVHQNVSILRHKCFVGSQDDTNYLNQIVIYDEYPVIYPLSFLRCFLLRVFCYIIITTQVNDFFFFTLSIYTNYQLILSFVALYFVNIESNYFYRRTFRNVSIGAAIFNFIVSNNNKNENYTKIFKDE